MFYKETEYALRSLIYIQLQNYRLKRPGVAEIAREIGAPSAYTAKILQRMVRRSFIRSQKGKNGGFSFDPYKPALELKEIVFFTEGDQVSQGCGLGLKLCSDENPCPMHKQFVPIRDAVIHMLTDETIQDLARKLLSGEEVQIGNFKARNKS